VRSPSVCQFGPVTITYDERVLRPRLWTLLQSDWAADLSPHLPAGPILELCAGAGQIGLAAAVRARRPLVQVEADESAAGFARSNAAAIGFTDVEVRCAPIADALRRGETFPLILADPPYVPTGDVGEFPDDPPVAIDGGPDGLDVIRTCLYVAREHLGPDGALLLQVRGEAQAREVTQLARAGAPALRAVSTQSFDEDRAVMHLVRADL
jgi:methylase of polypeptide subunit release factors